MATTSDKYCFICYGKDHFYNTCPDKERMICYVCGYRHSPKCCVDSFCSRCYTKGHVADECINSYCLQKYCVICFSRKHEFDSCKKINFENRNLKRVRCSVCNEYGHLLCEASQNYTNTKTTLSDEISFEEITERSVGRQTQKDFVLEDFSDAPLTQQTKVTPKAKISNAEFVSAAKFESPKIKNGLNSEPNAETSHETRDHLDCCNCSSSDHYFMDCSSDKMDEAEIDQGACASKMDHCDVCGARGHMPVFCPSAPKKSRNNFNFLEMQDQIMDMVRFESAKLISAAMAGRLDSVIEAAMAGPPVIYMGQGENQIGVALRQNDFDQSGAFVRTTAPVGKNITNNFKKNYHNELINPGQENSFGAGDAGQLHGGTHGVLPNHIIAQGPMIPMPASISGYNGVLVGAGALPYSAFEPPYHNNFGPHMASGHVLGLSNYGAQLGKEHWMGGAAMNTGSVIEGPVMRGGMLHGGTMGDAALSGGLRSGPGNVRSGTSSIFGNQSVPQNIKGTKDSQWNGPLLNGVANGESSGGNPNSGKLSQHHYAQASDKPKKNNDFKRAPWKFGTEKK